MRSKIAGSILGLALVGVTSGLAGAATIAGPAMPQFGFSTGFLVTGLEFQALTNSTLTSFTFTNQGKADTVVLTDTAGNILNSVSTPASSPPFMNGSLPLFSPTVSVNWSLTSGNSYWLLQTTQNNAWKTNLTSSFTLPSNADIAIQFAGTFAQSIASAVTGGTGCGVPDCINFPKSFWADFTNITTGPAVSAVPLPAALPLFATGLGALGLLGWRRKRKAQATA